MKGLREDSEGFHKEVDSPVKDKVVSVGDIIIMLEDDPDFDADYELAIRLCDK